MPRIDGEIMFNDLGVVCVRVQDSRGLSGFGTRDDDLVGALRAIKGFYLDLPEDCEGIDWKLDNRRTHTSEGHLLLFKAAEAMDEVYVDGRRRMSAGPSVDDSVAVNARGITVAAAPAPLPATAMPDIETYRPFDP